LCPRSTCTLPCGKSSAGEAKPYLILDVCNPQLARRGLEIEPGLGLLLPRNVVVRRDQCSTYLSAIEPASVLQLAGTPELEPIARETRQRLERVIERD